MSNYRLHWHRNAQERRQLMRHLMIKVTTINQHRKNAKVSGRSGPMKWKSYFWSISWMLRMQDKGIKSASNMSLYGGGACRKRLRSLWFIEVCVHDRGVSLSNAFS